MLDYVHPLDASDFSSLHANIKVLGNFKDESNGLQANRKVLLFTIGISCLFEQIKIAIVFLTYFVIIHLLG